MISLTRQERTIILFLIGSLLCGLGLKTFLSDRTPLYTVSNNEGRSDGTPRQHPLVNINSATFETLIGLDGIGPTLAGRIIEYRRTNGPFTSKDRIKEVKGIGDALFKKIEQYISVE